MEMQRRKTIVITKRAIGFDKKKAEKIMEDKGIDALILLSPANLFYTTGMPALWSDIIPLWFLIRDEFPLISIITKEGNQTLLGMGMAARDVRLCSWVEDFRPYGSRDEIFKLVKKVLEERRVSKGTIGIERTMPIDVFKSVRELLPDASLKMVADEVLHELRLIKSEEEIRRLRKAAELGQKSIQSVMENIKEGMTIGELVGIMKSAIIKRGGTGWNHTNVWCEKPPEEDKGVEYRLCRGDIVHMDVGAVFGGYTSDLRRTAVLGKPTKTVKKMYETILNLTEICMGNMRPGVKVSEVYNIGHVILKKAGYPRRLSNLGHSIGIDVEEFLFIRPEVDIEFKPNMVFCLEAWYPFEPFITYGVGIEDTGVITERGYERFTTIDRDLYLLS